MIGIEDYAQYEDILHQRYDVAEELVKAKAQASDPNTVWLTPDQVWSELDI